MKSETMSSTSVPTGKSEWRLTVDRPFYTMAAEEVAQRLQVDIQQGALLSRLRLFGPPHVGLVSGLPERIIEERQEEYGANQVQSDEASSWGSILLGALTSSSTFSRQLT